MYKTVKPPWSVVPFTNENNRNIVSAATTSSNGVDSASSSTSSSNNKEANNAEVDPFASWAWEDRAMVQRNNEMMNAFIRDGGAAFDRGALFNCGYSGFGPIMRPHMWRIRFGFCVVERVDLQALVAARGINETVYNDIGRDITRTYNGMPASVEVRQLQVYQLLLAVAAYNSSLYYIQGMDRIAVVLVDVFPGNASHQFWAFDYILTHLMPHYASRDMLGLHVDAAVLVYYVKHRYPKMAAAIERLDKSANPHVPHTLVKQLCSMWFPQLFVGVMRFTNVLRLWDHIILNGIGIMFNFMLRMLEMHRALIMNPATENSLVVFTRITETVAALDTLDDALVKPEGGLIPNNDVELRRVAELNAIVMARDGDKCYDRRVSLGCIQGYSNAGRGCLCTNAVRPKSIEVMANNDDDDFNRKCYSSSSSSYASTSSSSSSTTNVNLPLAARGAISISTTRPTSIGTSVALSNNTIGGAAASASTSNGTNG